MALRERFTIDEMASLSDEAAYRIRADARNLALARVYAFFFLVIVFFQAVISLAEGEPARALLSVVNLVLLAGVLFFFRRAGRGVAVEMEVLREGVSGRLSASLRVVVLVFLAGEFLLQLLYSHRSDGAMALLILFPYLIIPVRVLVSEALLLFAVFGAGAAAELILFGGPATTGGGTGSFVGVAINQGLALVVMLFATRRFRRKFREQWRHDSGDARERLRMREELDVARRIQLAMLPREAPVLPWVEIASLSLPATEVGGDYYDFYPLGEEKLAVVCGDVAGHGLPSGLVLSGLRSGLVLLAHELGDPVTVMQRLHHMIRATHDRMVVSLAILLLDRTRSRFTMVSAGHPPMLLRRISTGKVEEIETRSLPLGSALGVDPAVHEVEVERGDLMILQTDGVYEMQNAAGDQYGFARLARVVERCEQSISAAGAREEILRDLWNFKGDSKQEDDVSLILLRLS